MGHHAISRRSFLAGASAAAASLYSGGLLAQVGGNETVARPPVGPLRGVTDDGVRIFRGVPFAKPPVGPLRFQKPLKIYPWTKERDATHFAAASVQPGEASIAQSEDCLYLNIWAPEGKGPYPVFVWIHGGGFTGGNAFAPIFDGSEFAREGIIVVTVAYRLGILGFLDVGPLFGKDYAGSANNALRDLITSLEWVQDNIAGFGGDPGRVTVGGESAGAKLTDILMGTPSARHLFSSMISESGGAERVWPEATAANVAWGFAAQWIKDRAETVVGLKADPTNALIKAQQAFTASWPQHFPLRCEVDGKLLPRMPIVSIARGSSSGKRLLIGTNRDESALFIGPHPEHDATANDLGNLALDRFSKVYQLYAELYPNLSEEHRRIRALTAEEYWIPSLCVAEAHRSTNSATWMYRLDFAPSSGRYKGLAYHSEELGMVWDKPDTKVDNAAGEAALAKQMHTAWATFIRGEDPAAPGLPNWPRFNKENRSTMVFDTESRIEKQPQEGERKVWEGVL